MTFPDRYYFNGQEMRKMCAGFDILIMDHAIAFFKQDGSVRALEQKVKREDIPSKIGKLYRGTDSYIIIFPQFVYNDALKAVKSNSVKITSGRAH